jgi:subtilisin-like proprotein convertase family protein
MGVGYSRELVTWSKGEYHLATNVPIPGPPVTLQDDLATISATIPFIPDDHGDDIVTFADATPLEYTAVDYFGEGIISGSEGFGTNDIDVFSFVLGNEDVVFTISPAAFGPNLDILATLYRLDVLGQPEVIATSNPAAALDATFSINTNPNDPMGINLDPGTYYISVDGTGNLQAAGDIYTDYAILGYFSITGARNQHLGTLVGVDFDDVLGLSPTNWTRYSGGSSPTVLSDLVDEDGVATEYDLTISSSKPNTIPFAGGAVDPASLAVHTQYIDAVDGFIRDNDVTWTFTWSDLEPLTVYEVYVLGLSDAAGGNIVDIVGYDDPFIVTDGPVNFTQTLTPNQLYINDALGDANQLFADYTKTIMSKEDGTIEIIVANDVGLEAAIAGLAIREATLGSIQGIKWDDSGVGPNKTGAANGVQDMGELGLPDWLIYLDLNNNEQLDSVAAQDHTVSTVSADVPQVLLDGTSVKSVLTFPGAGSINDVNVYLRIDHTFDADLEVVLISPKGTRVTLFNDIGGFGDNFTDTVLDDSALTSITNGTAPFTGSFRPQQPLSTFIDEDPFGVWKLELTDDASGDSGVLTDWSLTINYTDVPVVETTVASEDVPTAIVDLQTVTSTLDFDKFGTIRDVNVTLDITHTWDADVVATLISPTGTRVLLFSGIGQNGDNFTNTTFDDDGTNPTPIANGIAPFTGTFTPFEALSAFDGEEARGTWTLEVFDTFPADQGAINNWSLTLKTKDPIRYLEPYTVTAADGSYEFPDLAPGVYYIQEQFSQQQIDDGWKQAWVPPNPITLKSGANLKGINFGNWIPTEQPGSIQGQKFNDISGDGAKGPGEAGLPGWIIYIDANENGVRDVALAPTSFASTDVPKPIDDLSTATSQVTVADIGAVFNITVTLDITHSFVGDMEAFLVSPSGTQVELFSEVGGQFNDFVNLTLDDNAARSIATLGVGDLPYTGSWRPEGQLSDFFGEIVTGIWTLVIRDLDTADEGILNSWSLNLTIGDPFTTTDANGNYSFTNLPEGDYIIREEPKPGWIQVPPANVSIPSAEWTTAQWEVTVENFDDPFDPNGLDAKRNVKNIDFSNRVPFQLGDYNRDGNVDAGDYVLWRFTLGTSVTMALDGADGDGDGMIDDGDYTVWRAHFGESVFPGSGSSLPESVGGASGAASSGESSGSGGGVAFAFSGSGPSSSSANASSSGTESSATESNGTKSAGGSSSKGATSPVSTNSSGDTVTFYVTAGDSSGPAQNRPVQPGQLGSSTRSDSALLSWLLESSSPQSDADAEFSDDNGSSASDADSVDAAFETLEELLLTGIAV